MFKFFVILITKILHKLGKLLNRGSAFPGKVALKLDKNILSKIEYPKIIIAVTGSNGKTSTTEMIASALEKASLNVATNMEGSNQIEGVTTMILNASSLFGKVKKDAFVIETEERYAKYIFKYFSPTHYLVTNLYRDQLTRNHYPEFIYDEIKLSMNDSNTKFILNADDPLVSLFGFNRDNTVYYGMSKNSLSSDVDNSVYNDCNYCPNCKHPLTYDYYHYNHIGSYHCDNCSFKRIIPKYEITDLDLSNGKMIINNSYNFDINLKSVYNSYNVLSCFAVLKELNIKDEYIKEALNNYVMKNDRIQKGYINNREAILITTKAESSISYNQSIKYVTGLNKDISVVILIDKISRKYITSETSWLFDIDFDKLNSDNIKEIIVSGLYTYDVLNRFDYIDNFDKSKLVVKPDIDDMISYLKNSNSTNDIYVFSCFTDRDKFLNRCDKKGV